MTDNVTVNTTTDVVEVVDQTTLSPVSITEDNISVGGGVDGIDITVTTDNVIVVDAPAVLEVVQEQTTVQPNVGDVHVQIMEDSEMTWARRTDFVGETIVYKGEAPVGSSESSAVWRVRRLTIATDSDVEETWASGTANFDKVWDDRALEVYS